jgi:hypothetical protein
LLPHETMLDINHILKVQLGLLWSLALLLGFENDEEGAGFADNSE